MNRIIILCFALLFAGMVWAQEAPNKKVAVLATTTDDKTIPSLKLGLVANELNKSIMTVMGFEPIVRNDISAVQVANEMKFSQGGKVATPLRDGLVSEVDILCLSQLVKDGNDMSITISLVDVKTWKQVKFDYELLTANSNQELQAGCQRLVDRLFGTSTSNGRATATIPQRNSGNVLSFTANGVSFEMIYVQGGSFNMSSNYSVTLSSYYMGKTEVTQALWEAVMGSTVRDMYNKRNKQDDEYESNQLASVGDTYPMYFVSWEDCQSFMNELNRLTVNSRPNGTKFALPTEAQWEFAARGGNAGKSKNFEYAGSNDPLDVAWYADNSGNRTHAVGSGGLKANELRIYDMSGNVWEWCRDWYGAYPIGSFTDPMGAYSGPYRVLRGGSWISEAWLCRVAFRSFITNSPRSSCSGFRLSLVQ